MDLSEQRRHAQTIQLFEKSQKSNNGYCPLLASTSYTGPKLDTQNWTWLIGTCYADVNGTLKCQFSEDDGEHWDGEHNPISYKADDKLAFAFEIIASHSRLIFENGNQDQSIFRLFTQLRRGI